MKIGVISNLLLVLCAIAGQSWSQEQSQTHVLDPIIVEGKDERAILEVKTNQPDTETTINQEGIDLYGGAGQISPFKAVDILPSVNWQSPDPYGLSNNQSIRIRGQGRVISNVEGLSLGSYGLTPGVADQWLFDMENLSGITLYRGAVGAEKSLGPYNTGGTVDRSILRPTDNLGFTFKESHGSFNFNKVFMRLDSGELPTDSKLFGSYSHTYANKWKGEGNFDADIFSFGLVQTFSSNLKVELFGSYSNPEIHAYRALTYQQAKDLSHYKDYDYNQSLTGNKTTDINYYDYNRLSFSSAAYFANIEIKALNGVFSIKPYYTSEDGYTLSGSSNLLGSPGVQRWEIDHDMAGVVSKYDVSLFDTDFTLGYWYFNQEPPGPPTAQKVYRAVDGSLVYAGWAMLADPTEYHQWHSPFLSVGKQVKDFYVKGGLRYVYEKLPSLDFYTTSTTGPDLSYDEALDAGTKDSAASVHGGSIDELLPNFGVNYTISDRLGAYFNYGRNFGRPAFDNWTVYSKNTSTFTSRGLTAQYLWDQTRPEISDNFDLGLRYKSDSAYITGTLFYGIFRDKGVSVADPNLGGLAYMQNVGEAESYGVELEAVKYLTKDLSVFASGSYSKFQFTEDIKSSSNSITEAEGNQVPDTPEYEGNLGLTYRYRDFSVSPILRYVGKRYGDVTNNQSISDYTTVDLSIRYTKEHIFGCKDLKVLSVGLDFYNLLDKEYISLINVSDDSVQGRASYYAGAPFTVAGHVELKF
jgi:iron complex outermembrane receptor protein